MRNAPVGNRSTAESLDYSFVVVPVHVFVDGLLEFREAAELFFVSVEHLLLPLGEKVLRLAVVQAVPLSRHRLYDPVLRKPVPVGFHLVLPPLVRMEDPMSCPLVQLEGFTTLIPTCFSFSDDVLLQ